MTVMISYARSDWERVEPIVDFLKSRGIDLWIDRERIPILSDWRTILMSMPRDATGFIPFLSRRYVASEMCRMELFLARGFGTPIFPVMLKECWDVLDTREETKYLGSLFAARMKARKVVGLPVTTKDLLERLATSLQGETKRPATRSNVYVSYPNGLAPYATEIARAIAKRGIRPWIATLDCRIGDDWRKVQVEAMIRARAHVVVLSESILEKEKPDSSLGNHDVLRTELLASEALGHQTACVISPSLASNAKLENKVYRYLEKSTGTFSRLTSRQWCRPEQLDELVDRMAEIVRAPADPSPSKTNPRRTRSDAGRRTRGK